MIKYTLDRFSNHFTRHKILILIFSYIKKQNALEIYNILCYYLNVYCIIVKFTY